MPKIMVSSDKLRIIFSLYKKTRQNRHFTLQQDSNIYANNKQNAG